MADLQDTTGADLVYCDNAATSFPKPPTVARAMARFLDTMAVNPGLLASIRMP